MLVLVAALVALVLLLLLQVHTLPLDVPREHVAVLRARPTFRAPGVVYMQGVLPEGLLATARRESLALPAVETQLGGSRSSGTVPASALEGSVLAAVYRCPRLRAVVGSAMGADVDIAPAQHPHSCSLLTYRSAGDHITHHYDTNWYRGRTYTALLTLVNENAGGACCSGTETCFTVEGREHCVPTRVNSLLVMEGARIRHRATALGPGETRVVLSMTFTTDRSQRGWQCLGRWIKDRSFGV